MAKESGGIEGARQTLEEDWAAGVSDKCAACPSMQAGECSVFQEFAKATGADPEVMKEALAARLER